MSGKEESETRDMYTNTALARILDVSQSIVYVSSSVRPSVGENDDDEEKKGKMLMCSYPKISFLHSQNFLLLLLHVFSSLVVNRYQKKHCFWWNLQII